MTLTIPVDYESDDGNLTDVEQIQEWNFLSCHK
jgi:hypothetical protein